VSALNATAALDAPTAEMLLPIGFRDVRRGPRAMPYRVGAMIAVAAGAESEHPASAHFAD